MLDFEGYQIQKADNFCNFEIKPKGKGSVSKELRGLFTTPAEAKKAIVAFNAKKERTNAKPEADGGV